MKAVDSMALRYLNFDYSEDTEGIGSVEAVASTWPEQLAAVHAEMVRVLDWAHQAFPDTRASVADGGDWDYDLHSVREFAMPEQIGYDAATRTLAVQAGAAAKPRHTVTLVLSGTGEFCSAFRQQFGLE
jgi:hypothetical protein